jgi:hypothetical protein
MFLWRLGKQVLAGYILFKNGSTYMGFLQLGTLSISSCKINSSVDNEMNFELIFNLKKVKMDTNLNK